jgi:5-methylcytosine-specific restriction endonuclease McrA
MIDGCKNKHYGKGFCNTHYLRNWKYGDPLFVKDKYRPVWTKEMREKQSKIMIGNKFTVGRKHSEETKRKMRIAHCDVRGENNPNFGKHPIPWNKGIRGTYISGIKNPKWNGGPNSINSAVRGSFEYKIWRTAIFQRDGYACVHCGKVGGELHVDHYPRSFASILRDENITSMESAMKCDALWDVNNNRTLCLNCHKKTESYMKPIGKRNNVNLVSAII